MKTAMANATRFFLVLFWLSRTYADLLTESFTTMAYRDPSSTVVWNTVSGTVHPGLQVSNYQVLGFPVVPTTNFEVGDGSHGDFIPATYANFGTVSGGTITVNALTYPVLKFKSFVLDNGYTLTAMNGPLVIYSLSTVVINGVINCDGANGSPPTGAAGGTGGSGRCGGYSGGGGGASASSGSAGVPMVGSVTAGGGGTYVGASGGAGGGGGAAYSGNDGSDGDNTVPAVNIRGSGGIGSAGANHEFTVLNGSPGGGGGSGSLLQGGGGGGGGGGTVVIHAVGDVTVGPTGFVYARGGNGANAGSGGGGGGGGGGSVKIFTPAVIDLNNGTDVDVTGGTGGSVADGTASAGGIGSFGRTWLNASSFTGMGFESHPSLLQSPGTIEFNTVSQTAISLAYDVSSTTVIYNSFAADLSSPDIVLEVSGSTDNFASVDTGWLPAASISSLNNHRYFKFKITLTNSNASAPTAINSVTLNYNPNLPVPPAPAPSGSGSSNLLSSDTIKFTGGCATVQAMGLEKSSDIQERQGKTLRFLIVLLLIPILIAITLRNQRPIKMSRCLRESRR